MKISIATCGTERNIKCEIRYVNDDYVISMAGILFVKQQPIYGLGFYEEKALRNALKQIKNKEIVKQIKKQFKLK